jgi:hypothetical protein
MANGGNECGAISEAGLVAVEADQLRARIVELDAQLAKAKAEALEWELTCDQLEASSLNWADERSELRARVAELEVQLADAQFAHRHQADYSAMLERHLFALKESARAVCEGADAGEVRLGLSILRAALAAQTKAPPTSPASSASTPHP